jgi:hypothetical protein
VKRSRVLEEMVRKARAEALGIEAGRLAAKRLIVRRKVELGELSAGRRQTLVVRAGS